MSGEEEESENLAIHEIVVQFETNEELVKKQKFAKIRRHEEA